MLILDFGRKVNEHYASNDGLAQSWQLVAGSGVIRRPREALSADPVTAVPSVVMQRKAKSGTIQPLRTCVAAFGIGVVACGVLQAQISLLIN